ncbi:MAG: hypothetical protein HY815_01025 [Candidatus Riflebacteria bacterium]|nr:hypothetical protein [Candidatus Riflebacteria bacterium]
MSGRAGRDRPGRSCWELVALVGLVLAFFSPGLTGQNIFSPFWTRSAGTGFPLLAEGQVGALYPPTLLLHALLPLPLAINLFIILHFVWAGVGAWVLGRVLGLSRPGALFAGAVFALSGFLVVHLKHLNLVASAAWAPFILASIELYWQGRRRTLALVGVAGSVAATILAGHHQTAYNNVLVAGLYVVALALGELGAGSLRTWVARSMTLLVAVLVGIALAAPQLGPTFELVQQGQRSGGVPYEEATRLGYHWRHLLAFVVPDRFGDPATNTWPTDPEVQAREWPGIQTFHWEITAYVGLVPLVLGLVCPLLADRSGGGLPGRRVWPLLGVAGLGLLLALGAFTPVHRLFFEAVPGFRFFRFPGRFLLHVDLALAVLAAISLDGLTSRVEARLATAIATVVIALSMIDLAAFGYRQNVVHDASRLLARPALADLVQARKDRCRILPLLTLWSWARASDRAGGWRGSWEPYLATLNLPGLNLNLLHDVPSLELSTPLAPRRIARGLEITVRPLGRSVALLAMANVRFVVTPLAIKDAGFVLRATLPGQVLVYECPLVMPRAYLAPAFSRVVSEDQAVAAIASPSFEPGTVVVEDPDGTFRMTGRSGGPGGRIVPATEVASGPDTVEFEVESALAGVFFVSELPYPGWTARVDGKPVTFHPANLIGRAIPLPAGRHRVAFRYACRPLGPACLLAALALVALLGLVLLEGRRDPSGVTPATPVR